MADFDGFSYTSKNFTKVPNHFLEWDLPDIDSMAELKVILYVMRHTWGFQEYDESKKITTDEFAHGRKRKDGTRMDRGTGLGVTAVKEGIKKAIEHGYLLCEIDDSDLARIKKYYSLRMYSGEEEQQG